MNFMEDMLYGEYVCIFEISFKTNIRKRLLVTVYSDSYMWYNRTIIADQIFDRYNIPMPMTLEQKYCIKCPSKIIINY